MTLGVETPKRKIYFLTRSWDPWLPQIMVDIRLHLDKSQICWRQQKSQNITLIFRSFPSCIFWYHNTLLARGRGKGKGKLKANAMGKGKGKGNVLGKGKGNVAVVVKYVELTPNSCYVLHCIPLQYGPSMRWLFRSGLAIEAFLHGVHSTHNFPRGADV